MTWQGGKIAALGKRLTTKRLLNGLWRQMIRMETIASNVGVRKGQLPGRLISSAVESVMASMWN
jgi:hypothetical protein